LISKMSLVQDYNYQNQSNDLRTHTGFDFAECRQDVPLNKWRRLHTNKQPHSSIMVDHSGGDQLIDRRSKVSSTRERNQPVPGAWPRPNGFLLLPSDVLLDVLSYFDQRGLYRVSVAATCLAVAASPEVWRDRTVELVSRRIRNSAQLLKALESNALRWRCVKAVALPQLQPSKEAARALRTVFPALQSADLSLCPAAGGQRVLSEVTHIERLVLPGYLPRVPLPQLKVLKLHSECNHLHLEGLEEWTRLPQLLPCLEILHAPWLEVLVDEGLSRDKWELLHQPPLGCKTSDACLLPLKQLEQLRELDLSDVYTLSNSGLRTLSSLPKLEVLILQNLGWGVDAEGLRSLAEGCVSLRVLDLRRCLDSGRQPTVGRTALTQADAVAFRRRRPAVELRFS